MPKVIWSMKNGYLPSSEYTARLDALEFAKFKMKFFNWIRFIQVFGYEWCFFSYVLLPINSFHYFIVVLYSRFTGDHILTYSSLIFTVYW